MRSVIISPLCPHEKEKKKDIKDVFELPLGGWKINRSFCLKVNKSWGYYNPTQLRIWWLIRRPLKKAILRRDDDLQRGNRFKSQFNFLLHMNRKERTQVIWLLTRSSFYLLTLFSWKEIIILTFLIPSGIVSLMLQRSTESNSMIN